MARASEARETTTLRAELERTAAFRAELRRFLRSMEAVAAEAGLTPQRYDLLLAIKTAPRECATVTDLCRALELRQTAVTELVKRAERAGLTRREQSSVDGRVFLLHLTSEGERRVLQVFNALRNDRAAFAEAFERLDIRVRTITSD